METDAENHWPVLVVEDDLPTAELEAKVLRRSGKTAHIAQRADEAISELRARHFSAVLLDYLLADENGWSVLEAAQACQPPVPVIVVTGRGNEEVAVEALRRGVADYIIKNGDYWEQLPNIVERIEKTAEADRLRKCLASVVESSDDAILGSTPGGIITSWNPGAARMFGYSADAMEGSPLAALFAPEQRAQIDKAMEALQSGAAVKNFDAVGVAKDGKHISLSLAFTPVKTARDLSAISVVARDITERKKAEENLLRTEFQLRRLQKFEAIREIAGGVAHEFNNLMTVVIVRSELLKGKMAAEDPMRADLDLIIKSGERAALVSRHLLAFSRQQFLRPKVIDLNTAILELQKMLQRLLGEKLRVDTRLDPQLGRIKADPSKIDEVVVNICMNASDAMPGGGTLLLETANVERDAEFARTHEGFKPGHYVQLSISDTGHGMDEATLGRIFEPFFTTKGRAKRTGLGLAMVYGTIKQSDGYIYASSRPGSGSRFEIYLPSIDPVAKPARTVSGGKPAAADAKTILVVEDEMSVLEIVKEILEHSGYTLLTANSPKDALGVAERFKEPINLLLTDVVMPEMNGPELAVRLCSLHPEMKVLYMSGYPENHLGMSANAGIEFLPKPFSFEGLVKKVREVLLRK